MVHDYLLGSVISLQIFETTSMIRYYDGESKAIVVTIWLLGRQEIKKVNR